jgi:hypothetical protein
MSNGLEVTREVKVTLTFNEDYAKKTERALNRALAATQKLPIPHYEALVNTGTIDNLLALREAIINALEAS